MWIPNQVIADKHINNFPSEDLRTIDQLWVKYSDGKFGFSVQKRIYQSLGGTTEDNREVWEKFGEQIGWQNYERGITFNITAPQGNLPRFVIKHQIKVNRHIASCLLLGEDYDGYDEYDKSTMYKKYYIFSRPDL